MQKMPNTFRASYSVLSKWAGGDWDGATEAYFKLKSFTTEEMADGKKYHEEWREETNRTGCLPEVFGGTKLRKPYTEFKKVIQIHDWLTLVGVIDCLDEPTIHEYKTGVENSEKYANSMQVGIYGVLCYYSGVYLPDNSEKAIAIPGVNINNGVIHHFNQYSKNVDVSYIYITTDLLNRAYDYVVTYSSEMHAYFLKNDLYQRFLVK